MKQITCKLYWKWYLFNIFCSLAQNSVGTSAWDFQIFNWMSLSKFLATPVIQLLRCSKDYINLNILSKEYISKKKSEDMLYLEMPRLYTHLLPVFFLDARSLDCPCVRNLHSSGKWLTRRHSNTIRITKRYTDSYANASTVNFWTN